MGKEYGLEEPYLCHGCGLTIQRHEDFTTPSDSREDMQDYHWAHFGQCHKCPPGFMCIEPEDIIRDTMHAGIQICPHVVWHTVHKRCKDKYTARVAMDAMELIGLPGGEVKVQSGKGKAIIKRDLPALAQRARATNKLRTAMEMYFAAFLDIATAKDVTPYMHEVAWYFPRWMELHGNLDALSARCMKHCNMEIKKSFRKAATTNPSACSSPAR
eukprot:jgi/Tetstr1/449036/TSEL_036252.t1